MFGAKSKVLNRLLTLGVVLLLGADSKVDDMLVSLPICLCGGLFLRI